MEQNSGTPQDPAAILQAAFIQTGVTWHDRVAALAAYKENHEILIDSKGEASTFYDGVEVPLAEGLSRFARDEKQHVDARTLPRKGSGLDRPNLESKADYPDLKSKAAVIRDRGFDYWQSLPAVSVETSELKTKADWYNLSLRSKVELTEKDPNLFRNLPNGPTSGSLTGSAIINHEALAKQKAIRPNAHLGRL